MAKIVPIVFCVLLMANGLYALDKEEGLTIPESALKGKVRTNLDSPEPTQAQILRKETFTKLVAALGVPVNEGLPVVEDVSNIRARAVDDIGRRTIAVAIAALKGEGMPHEDVMQIVSAWDVESYFSPEELVFIENPNVSDRDRIKFAWRYECLDVLLWALGYKENIPPPNEICDVKADVSIIINNKSSMLWKNARLRSMDELLDMADYYYRLHWGATELRLKGKQNESVNEEVIMERHYALNWLIRYMGQSWDEISTDT